MTDPSVSTSMTSRSKSVIMPTWVLSTLKATFRTGEKMASMGMIPILSPVRLRSALR